jgi:hypothetical protein
LTGYTVTVTGHSEVPGTTVADDPGGQPAADGVTWAFAGVTVCWVLVRMPDGTCADGFGHTLEEATADARGAWRHWKRGHAGRLAINGREYRRRLKARRRRRR